jgi:DNA recombination protein RmuC
VFGEHLGKLGKSLGSSVDSFNKAVGSLEQQVLPAARRFPELGLRVNREIEAIDPVASLVRIPRNEGIDPDSSGEVPPEST